MYSFRPTVPLHPNRLHRIVTGSLPTLPGYHKMSYFFRQNVILKASRARFKLLVCPWQVLAFPGTIPGDTPLTNQSARIDSVPHGAECRL